MLTMHEALEQSNKQCQALVKEIESFKQSRIMNQQVVDSLESIRIALDKTHETIKPFAEKRVKLIAISLFSILSLNTILLIVTIILFIRAGA